MGRDGFTGRGRAYSDFRPGYPDGLFEYMARQGLLTPETVGFYIHISPACFTAVYDKQKERNTL